MRGSWRHESMGGFGGKSWRALGAPDMTGQQFIIRYVAGHEGFNTPLYLMDRAALAIGLAPAWMQGPLQSIYSKIFGDRYR